MYSHRKFLVSILLSMTCSSLSFGASAPFTHSATDRNKDYPDVPNVNPKVANAANAEVLRFMNEAKPGKFPRIFLVETHRFAEVLTPGFLVSEEGETDFELYDGNYLQTTLEYQEDGSFIRTKVDSPQLVRKGKFLNSTLELVLSFEDEQDPHAFFLLEEKEKEGKITQILKAPGGAIDPIDNSTETSLSPRLLFVQAGLREFAEEILGQKFDQDISLNALFTQVISLLTQQGQFAIDDPEFYLNMSEDLTRFPRKELNFLCIASGTTMVKIRFKEPKRKVAPYLTDRAQIEKGKKAIPNLMALEEVQKLKDRCIAKGNDFQNRSQLFFFLDSNNRHLLDINELMDKVLEKGKSNR